MWGKREVSDWLRVTLAPAERAQVQELLEDAWRAKAPKRVLAAYDAARGRLISGRRRGLHLHGHPG